MFIENIYMYLQNGGKILLFFLLIPQLHNMYRALLVHAFFGDY